MDVKISEFRDNIKEYFVKSETNPVAVYRNSKVYVLMSKEHYVDLLHKAQYPTVMQMPTNVQTVVHFVTRTAA